MKLTINNFGPLDDATIQIGDFTVLAGPNNTGKSFVSKFLYSLFDAMNANHALVAFECTAEPLERWLQVFEDIGYKGEEPPLSILRENSQKIEYILNEAFSIDSSQTKNEIDKIRVIQSRLFEAIDQLVDNYSMLKEKLKEREDRFSKDLKPLDFLIGGLKKNIR